MNTATAVHRGPIRVPMYVAIAAAALTGTIGAVTAAAVARDEAAPPSVVERVEPAPAAIETPIWVEVVERARLQRVVDSMPAGWPATAAMRAELAAPLGSAAQRARWAATAELMPAGWPATEAMRGD